jgi:multiubiquitin
MSTQESATAQQGQTKEVTIIVNGRQKVVEKTALSFNEIVLLAYPNAQLENPDFEYKVTYTKGHSENQEGTLVKGKSVKVKEGMIFNVSETNKS